MHNIKIIIAEDEPDVLGIMVKKIAAAGYEVIGVSDGNAAWEAIQKEDPDMVLLDLTMPGLHGFEVLEHLRKTPPSEKYCPVIIVSAHDELDQIRKGFELNAEHYLTKPCSTEEILKSIELVFSLIKNKNF